MTSNDLPVDTSSTPPPGIKTYFMPDGGPLVLEIYPDADHGIVYRWDNGLELPPSVAIWRSAEAPAGRRP